MKEQYGVSLLQLEERFGMNRRAFTANTCRELNRIFVSLRDGMATVEDYFLKEEKKTDKIKNKLPVEDMKPKEQPKEKMQEVVEAEDIEQPTLL